MSKAHALPHNPVGRLTNDHPGVVKFGRAGWLAKGVVYLVAGVLALLIAAKASGWSSAATAPTKEASPTGALKTIAQMSGGALLMWVLAGACCCTPRGVLSPRCFLAAVTRRRGSCASVIWSVP